MFGEFDNKTAQVLISLASALLKNNRFSEAIKYYEHTGMILNRLESSRLSKEDL